MGNKIGRNEKCPCGSGKKYKHCCFQKENTHTNNNRTKSQNQKSFLRSYFQNYHTIDLAAILASLSIFPPNHGKNLRLEYLTLEALSMHNDSNVEINKKNLSSFLDKHFGSHELEDLPENLFTENVIYSTGNNTVYGGSFEQGAFTLNNLISAIQFKKDAYPEEFIRITNDAFLLLLKMSDLVAGRLGHKRNMLGDYVTSSNEIEFPENITEFKDALYFHNKWFDNFCNNLNIDKRIITYFSLNQNHRSKSKNEIGDSNNPLITKPILKLTNGILLVSPTTIISSLVHFAFVQSARYGCQKELLKQFHKIVWDELILSAENIEFTKEKFKFEKDDSLPIKSAIFRFDTNKLAYLSFTYDEGDNYNNKTPFHDDPMGKMKKVKDLQNKNFDLIKQKYKDSKFIDLTLYSSIGREYIHIYSQRENTYTLTSSVYKFLCWIKHETHDNMSLWYFLESRQKFLKSVKIISPYTNFLDYYHIYKNTKSFYLGDDEKPDAIHIIGGSLKIIKEAIDNEDKIIVYHKVSNFDHPVLVPVIKFDDYVHRYFNPNSIGTYLEIYLPEYPFDIWVKAKSEVKEIPKRALELYWLLFEAISYWFGILKELLKPHLKQLNIFLLLISFDLKDIELLENKALFGIKNSSLVDKFKSNITKDEIEIEIPCEICGHFSSSDNDGERLILKQILVYLSQFLEINNLETTLSIDVIDSIVNEKLPLGLKKMILFHDNRYSIALDPRNANFDRLIQQSRKQWYLDELIPLLGASCPPEGQVKEKEEKQKLAKSIAFALLKELRKILKAYDSKELLFEVMKNYESILHKVALSNLRTPARLHCFSEQEDIVAEIQKNRETYDKSTIALRCLIEQLSAEPSFGNSQINQQVIDDIIALMFLIVLWGDIGDIIAFDLFDIELEVLPSRRIGTNLRQISEQFFHKFSKTIAKEYIEDTLDNFSSYFVEDKSKEKIVPEGFNIAFANEIGIRFEKLGGIVNLLLSIGFEQNSPIASLSIAEIIVEVKNSFDVTFTDEEIKAGIKFLSLWNREDVTNVPDGFENIDISPWRYNRKLSYAQRPLILIDFEDFNENSIIYWTPRHLDRSWNFLNNLFISGRYRAKEKSDLERQISIIAKKRGAVVQKKVIDWFNEKTDCFIDEEVKISPNGKLKSSTDIGDSDVFAIDHQKGIIFSIECKRTQQAKNSKQMIVQVQHYFGGGSEMGYFDKHIRRHNWLESNLAQIGQVFNFDSRNYKVFSFFITYNVLAIQFMENRPLPIPMISLFELRKMDYEQLCNKLIK